MLSLLPPELLRLVFESSVTHTFHSDTYFERQSSLRSLCLVSRYFHNIAQPLLHEIVWIRSTLYKDRFDRKTTSTGNEATRWLVVGDKQHSPPHSEEEEAILCSVVREFPAINRLIANVAVDLDTLPSNLAHLQLSHDLPSASNPILLPNIRSLSLILALNDDPEIVLDILDLFPNLRALALQPYCRELDRALSSHRFQPLLLRLEMLKLDTLVWIGTSQVFREAASSRTILDCTAVLLAIAAKPAARIQHVIVKALHPDSDFYEELRVSEGLLEFCAVSRASPSLPLRSIYLDPSILHPAHCFTPLREALDGLTAVCEERGIDLVADRNNSLDSINPSIPEEFWMRQREERRSRVVDQALGREVSDV
ncbi:hypothetical protein JCM11491_002494 [Sporobolomyces phaffii]